MFGRGPHGTTLTPSPRERGRVGSYPGTTLLPLAVGNGLETVDGLVPPFSSPEGTSDEITCHKRVTVSRTSGVFGTGSGNVLWHWTENRVSVPGKVVGPRKQGVGSGFPCRVGPTVDSFVIRVASNAVESKNSCQSVRGRVTSVKDTNNSRIG